MCDAFNTFLLSISNLEKTNKNGYVSSKLRYER